MSVTLDICTYLHTLIIVLQIQCHEEVPIFIIYFIRMQPERVPNQLHTIENKTILRSNTLGEIMLSKGTPYS